MLGPNDWRQASRMAFGGFVGWALATLLGLPYALYYAVYPLVLLGLSPACDRHVALQFLTSAPTAMVAAGLMIAVFSAHPVAMTVVYLGFAMFCFTLMTGPRKLFMYGGVSLAISSGLLHFGSHPQMAWQPLFWAIAGSVSVSVALYIVSFALFPDVEPRAPRVPPARTTPQRRHLILLGALAATASFAFFQAVDLSDSLSAQMATVLILLGLTHEGIWSAGRTRLVGSVIGSIHAVLVQVAIAYHSGFWPLTAAVLLVGLLWFSAAHAREKNGSLEGFAAVTALAILFGLLTPADDMVGNSLYRGVSVVVAIALMLVLISLLHRALNRFAPTRWDA